jgi:N-acyl-D-amino-acid deacylase
MTYDTIIKHGTIADGTGQPLFKADVGIQGDRITALGDLSDDGHHIIDAEGMIVSPGFIDPHTHFDAQLLWDGAAKPALAHGVTTIVPGNCSLSLAPLKAEHRMKLVGMFNQIEEMPFKAFKEGVEWNWETFEEYVARISEGLAINVAPLVGHSLLRLWVMGDDSMTRAASPDEVAAIGSLLETCLTHGAIGLSTSFVDMDEQLQPVPSRYADTDELDALCAILAKHQKILQVVHEFYDTDLTLARIDQLADLSLKHDITTTLSPLFVNQDNQSGVSRVMERVHVQHARGARVWPQVQTRPIDISFCLEVPSLLFIRYPTWYQLLRFSTPEAILLALKTPETRAKLEKEIEPMMPLWAMLKLRRVEHDANQHLVGKTLAEIGELRGVTPLVAMIDLSIEENLRAHFLAADMGHNIDDVVGPLLNDERVMIGASDGGAHILSFSTYGDTGYLFSRFVRDNAQISIEAAVHKITQAPARIWNIQDRGVIAPGNIADITIFDADIIDRGDEYYVQDVPGEGFRYVRDALGIQRVLVSGKVAYSSADGYSGEACGQIV